MADRIMPMHAGRFRFGISELDELVTERRGLVPEGPWSAAIIGPDGTGKSILAMHVASDFIRSYREADIFPRVVYVSTDLSLSQAKSTWNAFGLSRPELRRDVLTWAYERFYSADKIASEIETKIKQSLDARSRRAIKLKAVSPNDDKDLAKLLGAQSGNTVWFLDLQKETAGDDWNFINHLLGLFESERQSKTPNLLIIDAIEGLEAFIGDIDTFGESRTRRSRVAQLVRNCVRSDTNVLFVVERQSDSKREPEQFIADYVFVCSTQVETDYIKRTIAVEKFRGAWHS